jgi:hypothetical protein
MFLAFTDGHGSIGMIRRDGRVEYDGAFEGTVTDVVDEALRESDCAHSGLQNILLDLPEKCEIVEIEFVSDD